jgi:hypothetical protein
MPTATHDPGKRMKEAVRKRVVLKTPHRRLRVIALATQEVVPLQNLVQHDSVDKPAQANSNQDPWRARTAAASFSDLARLLGRSARRARRSRTFAIG